MIIIGDALESLKTLDDESVDCCITSPPYYGLRDYGTGKWVGGDPSCKHEAAIIQGRFHNSVSDKQLSNKGTGFDRTIKVCPLCGAIREDRQIGLEETPEEYIEKLVNVFHEVKRVLKNDGTLWVNIGDSYWGSGSRGFDFTDKFTEASVIQQGSKGTIDLHNIPKLVGNTGVYKNKDLIGIPWMLAFALRADGWYLRQDIIWHKPNPMPESVKDRCTKSHEYIFLLSKNPHYYFNSKAIQEESVSKDDRRNGQGRLSYNGKRHTSTDIHTQNFLMITEKRNKRDVWTVPTKGDSIAHFATFPEKLIEPCILAASKEGGSGS